MDKRTEKAIELFKNGYNCSQSVFAAFADIYGMDEKTALLVSSSFGGGIGRMRETCGAACGMFLAAGLENGSFTPHDNDGKAANYKLVQELASEFKKRNGSLICAELLGLKPKSEITNIPDDRTKEYYQKRPCVKMVEEATEILLDYYKSIGKKI
ncbi:MAG: C-GCAxxG-C-C family protein [Bacteroidales bacterium]|nr:C-GCAxxG-C-C family protein [Bacteroidales bacterium]